MGATLPSLSAVVFGRRLQAAVPEELAAADPGTLDRLFVHYQELRRWNRRLSLVGPGTSDAVAERHYGESLAALSMLGTAGRVVDLGSGAGFPGWVLAAARTALDVTLVEARVRKAVFLRQVSARAALSCRCLGARVGASPRPALDERFELVTVRALKLDATLWQVIDRLLEPEGRLLYWRGARSVEPALGWVVVGERPLVGTSGAIVALERARG